MGRIYDHLAIWGESADQDSTVREGQNELAKEIDEMIQTISGTGLVQ
jgi:hypothetical protein